MTENTAGWEAFFIESCQIFETRTFMGTNMISDSLIGKVLEVWKGLCYLF